MHRSLAMNASKVAKASFKATKFVAIMLKRRRMEKLIIQQWSKEWTMTKWMKRRNNGRIMENWLEANPTKWSFFAGREKLVWVKLRVCRGQMKRKTKDKWMEEGNEECCEWRRFGGKKLKKIK